MDKELRIVLTKYFIIVALTILYIAFMIGFVGPAINHAAFGQSAFDVPNQFNNPQYNQYGQQQYDQYQQPYGQQYQQPYNDPYGQQFQYQQPYQQPYYGMQQQYTPQPQNPIQFGTSEVIYTLLGGGALGYARYNQHKRNQDKEIQREIMSELLREKQEKRELARVAYANMPQQGNEITDAPLVKLEKLDSNIQQFADKVAKA